MTYRGVEGRGRHQGPARAEAPGPHREWHAEQPERRQLDGRPGRGRAGAVERQREQPGRHPHRQCQQREHRRHGVRSNGLVPRPQQERHEIAPDEDHAGQREDCAHDHGLQQALDPHGDVVAAAVLDERDEERPERDRELPHGSRNREVDGVGQPEERDVLVTSGGQTDESLAASLGEHHQQGAGGKVHPRPQMGPEVSPAQVDVCPPEVAASPPEPARRDDRLDAQESQAGAAQPGRRKPDRDERQRQPPVQKVAQSPARCLVETEEQRKRETPDSATEDGSGHERRRRPIRLAKHERGDQETAHRRERPGEGSEDHEARRESAQAIAVVRRHEPRDAARQHRDRARRIEQGEPHGDGYQERIAAEQGRAHQPRHQHGEQRGSQHVDAPLRHEQPGPSHGVSGLAYHVGRLTSVRLTMGVIHSKLRSDQPSARGSTSEASGRPPRRIRSPLLYSSTGVAAILAPTSARGRTRGERPAGGSRRRRCRALGALGDRAGSSVPRKRHR